ncbi:MAG TPA: DNA repair protein RecO [Polyangia bacterium]|jgi:DNA repair protein RecO (recombination protein O)|nr:DNA repair protein RecO [Polyangia bacterium]HWE27743.1 DNA repair protein RecO [Polyangia bacterium]
MRLVTPAIVLRTVDYGDSDRIVTLFTRDAGKLSALARGARKSVKRFGAGLGLFGVGEAILIDKPNAELSGLERFDGARGFPSLMLDVAKVAHGSYACEVVRELIPQRHPEPDVFELLIDFFTLLENAPARAETLRIFELILLDMLGLRPQIERCVGCDTADLGGPGDVLDVRRGGVVCASCHGHGRAIGDEVRHALVDAQSRMLSEAAEFTLTPAVNAGCRELLAAIILDHVGRPLKSLEFINKLNHAGA